MKGHEKFLIATGFAAFILSIVFAVITVFSFIGTIRREVDTKDLEARIESGFDYLRDNDFLGINVNGDSVSVDVPGIDIDVDV
ncbi:MAG: hypothetical protein J5685_02310 [Clostridiales bacterium]|nr:hypothetical protein [Clostridiales bacterium]